MRIISTRSIRHAALGLLALLAGLATAACSDDTGATTTAPSSSGWPCSPLNPLPPPTCKNLENGQ